MQSVHSKDTGRQFFMSRRSPFFGRGVRTALLQLSGSLSWLRQVPLQRGEAQNLWKRALPLLLFLWQRNSYPTHSLPQSGSFSRVLWVSWRKVILSFLLLMRVKTEDFVSTVNVQSAQPDVPHDEAARQHHEHQQREHLGALKMRPHLQQQFWDSTVPGQ